MQGSRLKPGLMEAPMGGGSQAENPRVAELSANTHTPHINMHTHTNGAVLVSVIRELAG